MVVGDFKLLVFQGLWNWIAFSMHNVHMEHFFI
jgi:hypothetical protein